MDVVVPKTLETKVTWKQTIPCVQLVVGIPNSINIRLQDNPIADSSQTIHASKYSVYLRGIPQEQIKVYEKLHIKIPEGSNELPLKITLPNRVRRGYYKLHIILEDDKNNPVDLYKVYCVIDSRVSPIGDNHLSSDLVRSQLHDICAEDNRLLESTEIGLGDIASAVERCVQQWNNRAPRLSTYSGHTFPYPEILREGVIAGVLESICFLLERNRMAYASGGVNVDLERRVDNFRALAQQYQQQWLGGLCQAKNEENVLSFNNSIGYM